LKGIDIENLKIDKSYELSKIELDIVRHLFHYENTVESASRLFAPHIVCNYLFELTKMYSSFYEQTPILRANEIEKNSRLFITKCIKNKISTMLSLLGIAPLSKI
jgi:arginyl-tRNA synthetase